ncbi:MAG: WHG domain-containing protein [Actinomycetota bacterium]|nr:WHG domain-containing protein [Acidimicrobiia bacterium]MDQ3294389.1 WHG domain-containing protein [Actinomycetota bacterium]
MPRSQSPEVRRVLIERAAALLARREAVTLRSLVAGTGVSTMSVYTYFDGMPGLWGAVRQEGFLRLAERLAGVERHRDPVRHLSALGVAYVRNALDGPDLYRVMFDASWDLPDPAAAAAAFEPLVEGAGRAQKAGRFSADTTPVDIALRYWADGHGVTSLAVTGVLSIDDLHRHAPAMQVGQFVVAGDTPERARRSVAAAWRAADA